MFTIRIISQEHGTEYNTLCARYRKDVEENSIECFGCIGGDGIEEFKIDGNPFTHCYVMNTQGVYIDNLLSLVNGNVIDMSGPTGGTYKQASGQ